MKPVTSVLLAALVCGLGCASKDDAAPPRADATATTGVEGAREGRSPLLAPPERVLPPELNSPRYAAMAVASMPEPASGELVREIALHTSLYAFAIDLVEAGHGDGHQPLALIPSAAPIGDIDQVEFRLRVLAALHGKSRTVRWTEPADQDGAGRVLLAFRIDRRSDAEATVYAEVTYRAARSGSQRVQAVWDGAAWRINTAGVVSEW